MNKSGCDRKRILYGKSDEHPRQTKGQRFKSFDGRQKTYSSTTSLANVICSDEVSSLRGYQA